jgi:SEL1 protein
MLSAGVVCDRAYAYLEEAGQLGHVKAEELVAEALLFGDPLPQNVTAAREMYESLANRGNPRGQMGLGFLYTTGIAVNSSQARVSTLV